MRIKELCVLILFLINNNCFGQNSGIEQDPNKIKDWVFEDLKSKVKKVSTVKYEIGEKFGDPVEIKIDSTSVIFNDYGSYLSKLNYTLNERWYINCINSGNKDCSSNYYYYEYSNSSNCLISEKGQKSGYDSYIVENICENGLIQSGKVYFHGDKNAKKKYVYQYDPKGNCIKKEQYAIREFSTDETIENILLFEYNSVNKITEIKRYNSEGMMVSTTKYAYDIKGNMVLKEDYIKEYSTLKKGESKSFIYDEKNNLKYDGYDYGYVYDSRGNITQMIKKWRGEIDFTCKYYNYDKNGNWTEKMEFSKDGKPIFKNKRNIIY